MSGGPDATAFDVLHLARIKGAVDSATLDKLSGQSVADQLVTDGLLRVTQRGSALTREGIKRHAELIAQERAASDQEVLIGSYERFLAVNAPVKAACSAWQISSGNPEDLFEAADALEQNLSRVKVGLTRAGQVMPRFQRYLDGLVEAAGRVAEGDGRYVSVPGVASFHTLWFECHEDFLVTLGRERDEESQ
jgi:hypothetical protein